MPHATLLVLLGGVAVIASKVSPPKIKGLMICGWFFATAI